MKKIVIIGFMFFFLLFGFVFTNVTYATDDLPLYYNVTLKKSYYTPMTNQQIDEAISEAYMGHTFAKLVQGKLVNYNDFKAKVTEVFFQGLEQNLEEDEIIMNIVLAIPSIAESLPEIIMEAPDNLEVIDIY
ncbi:hypothetical protein KQI38_13915 [Tissierella carlieri]|uniref:hypothetical protein n=1 Tax=Tissierella carlieri TaxID=689904 RepID=UPI001C10A33F|nr:hypothetical protein [Tissierella carlieri]MBU5313136.1 hypothetical protein [Tissierella carlieri]